jgi:hypothetical protein
MNTFCSLFSFYIVTSVIVSLLDNGNGKVKQDLQNDGKARRVPAV